MKLVQTAGPSKGCIKRSAAQAGFTFAEVLAALLFMAIVIPVAMEALSISSRAGVVAERKSEAVRLADSRLSELIVTGAWKDSGQSGVFGPQWQGYRWSVKSELWTQDALHLVTVEVTYPVQNRLYSVRLSTLTPDAGQ